MVQQAFAAYLNGNARRMSPEVVARIEESAKNTMPARSLNLMMLTRILSTPAARR